MVYINYLIAFHNSLITLVSSIVPHTHEETDTYSHVTCQNKRTEALRSHLFKFKVKSFNQHHSVMDSRFNLGDDQPGPVS